ncbi:MAG TPA: hypothetical protein PLS10_05890 [Chitinophagales bacterium]|nr:hypothetical protein [Chitinophagales bacterium]
MKTLTVKIRTAASIVLLTILTQACSTHQTAYPNYDVRKNTSATNVQPAEEELSAEDAAAALLIISALSDENEGVTYQDESSNYSEEEQPQQQPQLDIHDMVSTTLANNIVY